jgi:hypothetical protein
MHGDDPQDFDELVEELERIAGKAVDPKDAFRVLERLILEGRLEQIDVSEADDPILRAVRQH